MHHYNSPQWIGRQITGANRACVWNRPRGRTCTVVEAGRQASGPFLLQKETECAVKAANWQSIFGDDLGRSSRQLPNPSGTPRRGVGTDDAVRDR